MFWDKGYAPSANIEALLEKEGSTVEEFLDEEDILQECKTPKKNIVNYFTRPEVIRRLVELITTEPSEDLPMAERYRHANMSCEILTLGLPSLDEKLLSDADTLQLLYSYLERKPPLNPLLASFFCKTFSMLFTKKLEQDWFLYQQMCLQLLEYIKSQKTFLDLICNHFETPVIPDLIMQMMRDIDGGQLKRNLYEWLTEDKLVERLIAILRNPEETEKHAKVSELFCDLINQGREMRHTEQENDSFEPAFEGSNPILRTIESADTIEALLNVILEPNAPESAILSGISVVLTLIKPIRFTDELNADRQKMLLLRDNKFHQEVKETVINAIAPRLEEFVTLLKNPPRKSSPDSLPPFGKTRLHICRVFTALLETKHKTIQKAICETEYFNLLLEYFKEYNWNNFLHSEVEKALSLVFEGPEVEEVFELFDISCLKGLAPPVEEAPAPPTTNDNLNKPTKLQQYLIVDCKLIPKLMDFWRHNAESQSAQNGRRLAYMGHLIKIIEHITRLVGSGHCGDLIASSFENEADKEYWQSLINEEDGECTKETKQQNKYLANSHPQDDDIYNMANQIEFHNFGTEDLDHYNVFSASNQFGQNIDDDDDDDDEHGGIGSGDGHGMFSKNSITLNNLSADPWDIDVQFADRSSAFDRDNFADFDAHFSTLDSDLGMSQFDFAPTDTIQSTEATEVSPTSNNIAEQQPPHHENDLGETMSNAKDVNNDDQEAEYDNNANVEKATSDKLTEQKDSETVPNTTVQSATSIVSRLQSVLLDGEEDYEDDEGMWTKPLGGNNSSSTISTDQQSPAPVTNGPSKENELNHANDNSSTNDAIDDSNITSELESGLGTEQLQQKTESLAIAAAKTEISTTTS